MSSKIPININELFKTRYGNKLEDLKHLLMHTAGIVDLIMKDKDADAPEISAGQVVGMYWKEVLHRAYTGGWDTYFCQKAIEAINEVLPNELQNSDDFTAGFTAVLQNPNDKEQKVLADLGLKVEAS